VVSARVLGVRLPEILPITMAEILYTWSTYFKWRSGYYSLSKCQGLLLLRKLAPAHAKCSTRFGTLILRCQFLRLVAEVNWQITWLNYLLDRSIGVLYTASSLELQTSPLLAAYNEQEGRKGLEVRRGRAMSKLPKRRSDDNGVVCCQRLLKLRLSTSNILILLSLAFL